ncbi:flagellar biosynthetic protein FliR [Pantoea eucrina]|uniref:Flagellar biosynthetic protein FliR n=1 Tax=Pantoea eucrina TaxID=472693 RepID=A0ABS1Z5H5_9GAMM|nr:flagellar biosynthetic protein FliR [Pantoea eucrina]AIX51515.1 flagellar biosynthesis protein FliR [Pantoea sp. PSNIH1]MBM0747694.1 flagellar type III secretion system protein FliR [Pantoea eucrina]UBB12063.1 flagellar type III secretion system protein FliR [Pantoea eucrina]
MVTLDSSQLIHWVAQFFWPMARLLALFASAPVLNERNIPKRVKVALAFVITWILLPLLPPVDVTLFSPAGFWMLIQQLLIGAGIGLTMQLAFSAVKLAGEIIGLQMGLSFATLLDPNTRVNMPLLARFLDMLAMLLFLTFNGHLWLISLLADSFQTLPVSAEPLSADAFIGLVKGAGLIFLNGMMLALPLIILLLTLNLALGLLNRVSPQLSVFAIGFPVTLTVGILSMGMLMPLLAPFCEHLFSEVFDLLARFASELSPAR